MEIKLDVDATGRKRGSDMGSSPFTAQQFATVPKVKVGAKSGQARIAALKVNKPHIMHASDSFFKLLIAQIFQFGTAWECHCGINCFRFGLYCFRKTDIIYTHIIDYE
jgi:hypothetical protein